MINPSLTNFEGVSMKPYLLIFSALFIASCSTDDASINPGVADPTTKEYYPLTVGSYWVYDVYEADTSWTKLTLLQTDSVVVIKDTVINGSTYVLVRRSFFGDTFYRDSSGIIVQGDGIPVMSITPGITLLNNYTIPLDTAYTISLQMAMGDSLITVPAGQFQAKIAIGSVDSKESVTGWMKHRTYHSAFARNVGCIFQRALWLRSGGGFEFRLRRYSIK